MENTAYPSLNHSANGPDPQLFAVESLLGSLEEVQVAAAARSAQELQYQQQLTEARLGMATGVFAALRAKHPATALHCLRVALGCSSWALQLKLSEDDRDALEVAALLHDVGKIGVPDHVLQKSSKLTGDEVLAMDLHRRVRQEILRGFCLQQQVLEMVEYSNAWFDGSRHDYDRRGEDLPLGARMIAIVDAYDAMTTDHVYRRAMSRERALAELFEYSGRQFDSHLVKSFAQLITDDLLRLNGDVGRRWLQQLRPENANRFWGLGQTRLVDEGPTVDLQFYQNLLENMHDAVIFLDAHLRVLLWNRAAERLTGIAPASIVQQQWLPSLLAMRDESGSSIADVDCPVAEALASGGQKVQRMSIFGRNSQRISVDAQVIPVLGPDGRARGAALLLQDASRQITLEQRVQTLQERATRDPLTGVANRAEFDRALQQFVATHLQAAVPCSLIMCDLDHFKRVNDTYGHQAGDGVLIAFAGLLQRFCRNGDFVGRYGGEEFVVLCADCDNSSATQRAEEIRQTWADYTHDLLGGERCTSSFGVTELQPGDTHESLLRRADRALLQAKDNGRNMVVQLGSGMHGDTTQVATGRGWFSWIRPQPGEQLVERTLVTSVPLKVAAEKLRGFVSDHGAELVTIQENRVVLMLDRQNLPMLRRAADRGVSFFVELQFEELPNPERGHRTVIQVVIRPKRQRDRRRRDAIERARQVLVSLKSYFMAQDHTERVTGDQGRERLSSVQRLLNQWLKP